MRKWVGHRIVAWVYALSSFNGWWPVMVPERQAAYVKVGR